jgi:hypothetical protein
VTNPEDSRFVAQRDALIDSILNLPQMTGAFLSSTDRCELQTAIASYSLALMAICERPLPPDHYDAYIRHIFTGIAYGRGKHGDFLRSLADTMLRADPVNFARLRAGALLVIEEYGLRKYLDDYSPDPTAVRTAVQP